MTRRRPPECQGTSRIGPGGLPWPWGHPPVPRAHAELDRLADLIRRADDDSEIERLERLREQAYRALDLALASAPPPPEGNLRGDA